MNKHGGFEHNLHSLRIVEHLERRYPGFRGLNLTWEVREGIAKHSTEHDRPDVMKEYEPKKAPCLEAQIVDMADEIAYNNHDIDDGLSSEMLDVEQLNDVELWQENYENIKKTFPKNDFKIHKSQTIIQIINQQVTDLAAQILKEVEKRKASSAEDIREIGEPIACFSHEMNKKNTELKRFLIRNFLSSVFFLFISWLKQAMGSPISLISSAEDAFLFSTSFNICAARSVTCWFIIWIIVWDLWILKSFFGNVFFMFS